MEESIGAKGSVSIILAKSMNGALEAFAAGMDIILADIWIFFNENPRERECC
jgi:hypothetical protein